MQSKSMMWAGRVVSALVVLFFLFDSITKIIMSPIAIEATIDLGYQESHVMVIGILLLVCTLLYIIPQTAILGAILLTAYMGGAVATHVRAGSGLFEIGFSVAFGVLVWLGIYLRNARLRKLIPISSSDG